MEAEAPVSRTKRILIDALRLVISLASGIAALGIGWAALMPEVIHVATTPLAQLTLGDLFEVLFLAAFTFGLAIFAGLMWKIIGQPV